MAVFIVALVTTSACTLGGEGFTTPEPPPDGGVILPPDAEPLPSTIGVVTVAGAEDRGRTDGFRDEARFANPVNLALLRSGQIFVSDFDNDSLRRVSVEGVVTTVPISDNRFARPFGIASDFPSLYVQTDRNLEGGPTGALWRINPQNGDAFPLVNDSGRLRGLILLPDGRLAAADIDRHTIYLYNPDGNTLKLVAGTPGVSGFADGDGLTAVFNEPNDLEVDDSGRILVADRLNNRIRAITLTDTGATVETVCGTGIAGGDDGSVETATLSLPKALARDTTGAIYIADNGTFTIRKLDLVAGTVTTVAGNGEGGFRDSDDLLDAQFFGLEGLDDLDNVLYVADGTRGGEGPYHRIRRIRLHDEDE